MSQIMLHDKVGLEVKEVSISELIIFERLDFLNFFNFFFMGEFDPINFIKNIHCSIFLSFAEAGLGSFYLFNLIKN